MSNRPSMPEAGELIAGRYRVECALKRGGMGAVYVARHETTGRRFALKLMSHELMGDREAEARFDREARAESSIDHPGIVKVYDIGRHGDFPYMVMELLEGESLGEFLARGPMPPDDAMLIMSQVLDAMRAAHAQGVVHRDLKPDNIYLVAGDGPVRPKILDFGISKLVDQEVQSKLTQTGVALGTPLYMSPEQVRGERDLDRRTDVYSLGVILYQMVTGKMPYTGSSYAELVFKIMNGQAPGVRELNPDIPEHLEAVIRCAMSPQLEHRYPDMQSFAADMGDLVRGARPSIEARLSATVETQEPTPFATTAEREAVAAPRNLRPVWIAAGLAMLGIGVTLGAVLGGGPRNAERQAPVAGAAGQVLAAPDVVPPASDPATMSAAVAEPSVAEPSVPGALDAADAGTASPEPAAEAGPPAHARPAAGEGHGGQGTRPATRPNRPPRSSEAASGDTPVLRVTPRGGSGEFPEPAPTDRKIKMVDMVDDDIIDPF